MQKTGTGCSAVKAGLLVMDRFRPAAPAAASAICLLVLLCAHAPAAAGESFPRPRGPVNDFAGVISPRIEAAMENLSREVLRKTGAAVVVAAVDTVGDSDPALYVNELYEAWGIGKKGEDKGVLILLALKERAVRIENGYGVEGTLPDGLAGSILDRYCVPYLKQEQYGKGLFNAMAAVSGVIAKDAGVTIGQGVPRQQQRTAARRSGGSIIPLIVVAFFFLSLFSRRGRGLLPLVLLMGMSGRGGLSGGGFGSGGFSGGFGGFGGGLSGGGGAGRSF